MLIEDGLDPAVLDLFMKTKSWIAHCYLAEEYRALMSQAERDLRSELDEKAGAKAAIRWVVCRFTMRVR